MLKVRVSVSGCEERNSVEILCRWMNIYHVCKIQRNEIISIKDNVDRLSSYLLTCLLHAKRRRITHSSHIHIV